MESLRRDRDVAARGPGVGAVGVVALVSMVPWLLIQVIGAQDVPPAVVAGCSTLGFLAAALLLARHPALAIAAAIVAVYGTGQSGLRTDGLILVPVVFPMVAVAGVLAAAMRGWSAWRRSRLRGAAVRAALGPLEHPAIPLLAVVLAIGWLSTIWAPHEAAANQVMAAVTMAMWVLPGFALLGVGSREPRATMLLLLIGTLSAIAAIALWVHDGASGRMLGTQDDPNYLATTLVPVIVVAVHRLGIAAARTRPALAASLIACLAAVAGTQSRGALVALGIGLALLALVRGTRVVVAAIVLASAVAATIAFGTWAVGGGQAIMERTGSADPSAGRVDLWRVAVEQVRRHPLAGVGAGGFVPEISDHVPAGGREPDHVAAHNTPLQVTAELGIPAGLAWSLAMLAAIVMPIRRERRDADACTSSDAAVACAFASVAAASLLLTLYAEPFYWLLLAACVVAGGHAARPAAPDPRGH